VFSSKPVQAFVYLNAYDLQVSNKTMIRKTDCHVEYDMGSDKKKKSIMYEKNK